MTVLIKTYMFHALKRNLKDRSLKKKQLYISDSLNIPEQVWPHAGLPDEGLDLARNLYEFLKKSSFQDLFSFHICQ